MSAEQTAARFVAANNQSPVVAGYARNAENGGGQGGTYVLDDGRRFTLGLAACRALPDGYPKWKLT